MAWQWSSRFERALIWLTRRLPRSIVRWVYVGVFPEVAMGNWGARPLSQLTVTEALRRWDHMSDEA
jgi:hypothetical protein